jgi:hypothetical protein
MASDRPDEVEGEQDDGYTGKLYFESRRYTFEGDGTAISVQDDAIVIQKEGVYLLSGRLTEGRIVTDAPCVRLVLDGAELCSSVSSVIESRRGTLIIESREDSLNLLRCEAVSDGTPQGTVQTEGELFFMGKGRTVISAPSITYAVVCGRFYGESGDVSLTARGGILCRNALISGGRLSVSGADTGIYAEGLIEMTGGAIVALCLDIGLYAEEKMILTAGERDISAPRP